MTENSVKFSFTWQYVELSGIHDSLLFECKTRMAMGWMIRKFNWFVKQIVRESKWNSQITCQETSKAVQALCGSLDCGLVKFILVILQEFDPQESSDACWGLDNSASRGRMDFKFLLWSSIPSKLYGNGVCGGPGSLCLEPIATQDWCLGKM